MRSIPEPPVPQFADVEVGDVEAILTEVSAWAGELRCASMGHLVQSNVRMSQMHVLWLLQHHGAMAMGRIADLLDVSLSNASGIIDRMEEHGLIERVRVPDDRRLVLVRPAEAGMRAIRATETGKRERMRAVVKRLPVAERTVVLSALRSLRRALSEEVESAGAHQHHFAESAN